MTDLSDKSRWAKEAIGPANTMLRQSLRGIVDLPRDVTPGAKQVAQLSAWRVAQDYALDQVRSALEELSRLPDWSGGFLVADSVDFDWRTAPFRHYASFADFYYKELEVTWKAWDALHAECRKLIEGD